MSIGLWNGPPAPGSHTFWRADKFGAGRRRWGWIEELEERTRDVREEGRPANEILREITGAAFEEQGGILRKGHTWWTCGREMVRPNSNQLDDDSCVQHLEILMNWIPYHIHRELSKYFTYLNFECEVGAALFHIWTQSRTFFKVSLQIWQQPGLWNNYELLSTENNFITPSQLKYVTILKRSNYVDCNYHLNFIIRVIIKPMCTLWNNFKVTLKSCV